jgi:tetratricopeptide (TPR) repeat protein
MALDKLKVAARQHELREEWRDAIELYRQAIREGEGGVEGSDPAIYNRIGDLALKAGDILAACEAWEQAATRYGEQGFFNNAIALCGKTLRLDPTRIHVYLELARFQAKKRVLYDVSDSLRTYYQHMVEADRSDDARGQCERLLREFPGWRGLEALINELLGRDSSSPEAAEGEATEHSPGGLVFIDTGPLTIERASNPDIPAERELGVITTVAPESQLESHSETGQLTGLEATASVELVRAEPESVEGLVGADRTGADTGATKAIDGLERAEVFEDDRPPAAPAVAGLEATSFDPPADFADQPAGELVTDDPGIVFLDTGAAPPQPPPRDLSPDDPLGNRVTAHALLEHGDRPGGIAALEAALAGYVAKEEWLQAFQVATELTVAEPPAIHRHQARVELASRMRDVSRLCEAYVSLAEALGREGSTEKSVAVYRRILELDEYNTHARDALRAMAPEAIGATEEGFVDFGAMVIDDAGPRSTRMRTETPDVAPDEEDVFRDALAEFKRALDQNLPIEDHQAHYDLGIAFKEMGLLDEAIGEFQKALRAPEVRLRTSEALGQVFFDQNRPAVAEAVLRSVEKGPEGDAEKIGVLYWLGRALEAQGKDAEARGCYERVLAVDVGFVDASDRLTNLDTDGAA